MQHSSDSVAALAAALAKAQARLVNPEKSLTATIRTGRMGETERTFRYAPLSSGLEIVRKTLSEHEIAVIQTTALDPSSRILNLTTMLAHASGEWISSQWPVCALADIASPHRMGAALTYARRYALFTLVGIAGEDDLDAPDLCTPEPSVSPPVTGVQVPARTSGNGRMSGPARAASSTILPAEQSAALRDRLVGEIAGFQSQDRAAVWAKEALPLKNTLTAADARLVETAFALKQSAFSLSDAHEPSRRICSRRLRWRKRLPRPLRVLLRSQSARAGSADAHEPGRIDKSVLTLSTPPSLPQQGAPAVCCPATVPPVCPQAFRSSSPAIRRSRGRSAARRAMNSRSRFAAPITARSIAPVTSRPGGRLAGIDPLKMARKLWKLTRMHEPRITSAAPTQDAAAERPAASDRQVPGRPTTA